MRAIIITIVIIIILITIIIVCTDERGTRMDELLRTCLQFRPHQGTNPCVYVRAYGFALSKGAPPLVCARVRYARACVCDWCLLQGRG